eukprot:m.195911 g.195911  ORF g.195911 m.195911 type:complete len:57 (+) comp15693_c1_seq6:88-258(+)
MCYKHADLDPLLHVHRHVEDVEVVDCVNSKGRWNMSRNACNIAFGPIVSQVVNSAD